MSRRVHFVRKTCARWDDQALGLCRGNTPMLLGTVDGGDDQFVHFERPRGVQSGIFSIGLTFNPLPTTTTDYGCCTEPIEV